MVGKNYTDRYRGVSIKGKGETGLSVRFRPF